MCGHKKGRRYQKDGKKTLCVHELDDATDAYEWSFVAVPAQRCAGVVKHLEAKADAMDVLKSLQEGSVSLSEAESRLMCDYIDGLRQKAAAAEEYLALQKNKVMAHLCADRSPEEAAVLKAAVDRMTPHELFRLYQNAARHEETAKPKLAAKQKSAGKTNHEFLI